MKTAKGIDRLWCYRAPTLASFTSTIFRDEPNLLYGTTVYSDERGGRGDHIICFFGGRLRRPGPRGPESSSRLQS